jgi:predicted membrane channel-forming protein YqfA (hemolysin III family)
VEAPGWFGYHEVFHVCVILGAALHYAGAWLIVG